MNPPIESDRDYFSGHPANKADKVTIEQAAEIAYDGFISGLSALYKDAGSLRWNRLKEPDKRVWIESAEWFKANLSYLLGQSFTEIAKQLLQFQRKKITGNVVLPEDITPEIIAVYRQPVQLFGGLFDPNNDREDFEEIVLQKDQRAESVRSYLRKLGRM